MDLCNHVIDVESLVADESFKGTPPQYSEISSKAQQDSETVLGVERSKCELLPESEMGRIDTEGGKFWKGLVRKTDGDEGGRATRSKDKDSKKVEGLRGSKVEAKGGKNQVKSLNKVDDGRGLSDLTKGLQAADRLNSLKVPQAMVAFAQAAAKVNELPGWPLLPKSLMKKCEKCSREFFSTLNYRRHRRLHRRSLVNEKDLRIERSQLASYWSKLSTEEASEVLFFKNMEIENLTGTSAVQALKNFIQQPSLVPFPHAYMKAGSVLLDLVQRKATLSADKLLKVLDDASEGTLCGGTSLAVQRFVGVEKTGLEEKNVVASMSFLVEQTLLKAWMAERNVEAMRCEKALVEEEEAAQRKRAKILEKKQQRRIRQKGHKEPDHLPTCLDPEVDAADASCAVEEDDYGSSSCSVVSSGQDLEGPEAQQTSVSIDDNGFSACDAEPEKEEMMENAATLTENINEDLEEESSSKDEAFVDQNIGRAIRDRRRSGFVNSSAVRTRRDTLDFRPRRNQHFTTRGDTRKKLTGVYRGIVKGGSGRVVWTRKVSQPSRPKDDETQAMSEVSTGDGEGDPSKGSLLVGSLTVPLGEYTRPISSSSTAVEVEAKQPAIPSKVQPAKVWKAVVKSGDQNGTECAGSAASDKSNGEYEQAFPPKLNVVVRRPSLESLEGEDGSTCFVDYGGASASPTSELLANFLSERWATAVEARSKSKHRAWPVKDQNSNTRNYAASSCGKLVGRWHQNLKEKHSEQRYMPRRQISMA